MLLIATVLGAGRGGGAVLCSVLIPVLSGRGTAPVECNTINSTP